MSKSVIEKQKVGHPIKAAKTIADIKTRALHVSKEESGIKFNTDLEKENSYDPNRHNGSFKFTVKKGSHAKNYKAGK
tara:strand:+ start:569 stop:799 length:231 start_codon:yes stop_codon:yes gene_type:complete